MPKAHHCSMGGCPSQKLSCKEHYVSRSGLPGASHNKPRVLKGKKCEHPVMINEELAKCGFSMFQMQFLFFSSAQFVDALVEAPKDL